MSDNTLAGLVSKLSIDTSRCDLGHSSDIEACTAKLLGAESDATRKTIMEEWLIENQPCLFGRIAAKNDLMAFCFITDADIALGDASVRDKIQEARRQWSRAALKGRKHGFIVLVVSRQIAESAPDLQLRVLAERIASLYLLEEVAADTIMLDRLFLEIPGVEESAIYMWDAGVNFFGIQGDKKWWCDHRIPGGIGFSINSVGHMVKSGRWRELMLQYEQSLGLQTSARSGAGLATLETALSLAVKTIDNASDSASGKATWLVSGTRGEPVRKDGKSLARYMGYYHTDHTIPACYFQSDVGRPSGIAPIVLDFSYLYDVAVDNVDHLRLGTGRRIRDLSIVPRRRVFEGVRVSVETEPRLKALLEG